MGFWIRILLLLALFTPVVPLTASAEDGFVIIAHPDTPATEVTLPDLGRIFRKKITHWENGTPILPVEQGGLGARKISFHKAVLNMGEAAVNAYWINQAMTSGRVPPKRYDSPRLVIEYVSRHPGAIGFVAADTPIPARVRVVPIRK